MKERERNRERYQNQNHWKKKKYPHRNELNAKKNIMRYRM